VYRACGYRVGWAAFSGDVEPAREYLAGLDKLSSLRLCSNVPGQWAVQTALGGYQSIHELTRPGGRLFQSRQAILEGVRNSKYLQIHTPMGAIYGFVGVKEGVLPDFDDERFAMDLLEYKHVLIAPGTSFNAPYKTHFRITNLPDAEVISEVFRRMEEVCDSYLSGNRPADRAAELRAEPRAELKVVAK
jgi:alanine-synthesizing transaminase